MFGLVTNWGLEWRSLNGEQGNNMPLLRSCFRGEGRVNRVEKFGSSDTLHRSLNNLSVVVYTTSVRV